MAKASGALWKLMDGDAGSDDDDDEVLTCVYLYVLNIFVFSKGKLLFCFGSRVVLAETAIFSCTPSVITESLAK